MFGNNKLSFFAAGLVAVLAACHPGTPVQSASSANAAVQCADASAPQSTGREARSAFGFAPGVATPAPCLSGTAAKPADAPNGDDPIWRLDMP